MKKFANLPIKLKIIISFTLCNILFFAMSMLFIFILSKSQTRYIAMYDNYGRLSSDVSETMTEYYESMAAMESALCIDLPEYKQAAVTQADEALKLFESNFNSIGGKIVDADIKSEYDKAKSAFATVKAELSDMISQGLSGDYDGLKYTYNNTDFASHNATIEGTLTTIGEMLVAKGEATKASVSKSVRKSIIIVIAVMLICIAFTVFITFFMSSIFKKPALNMRDETSKMAQGDMDVKILHYNDDELGELSDALIEMAKNVREQAEITREISEGNLNLEVTPRSEGDLMGNSLAVMVSEENRVMSGIKEAVMEIRTGSQQVAAASQSLAQGSTEQASAIQEITASISDITERTKVNANEATAANGLVEHAKTNASEGNGKMHEMIVAMDDINRSSENISKIIKVIDDIAFQTNILALNAAVEAARAGQHGRGFAVVAEEVRNLAGKSAQAARETAELIEDSIVKVEKGSKLAEETAAALEQIVGAITRIYDITNSIAVASNDQATAISQIDLAINQVSQVVQTNSATSEECAAASEELSAQAGKLRDMISRYRLKSNKEYTNTSYQPNEPVGLPEDEEDDEPPVISLDDGFGKY